jgi:hypothetical protein
MGCAVEMGKQAAEIIPPKAGSAVVYIYRVDVTSEAAMMVPNVRVNYGSIGSLIRNGFFRVEADPGLTQVALYNLDRGDDTFWPASQNAVVNLNLTPNSTHFIELTVGMMNFSFRETSRETALQRIATSQALN